MTNPITYQITGPWALMALLLVSIGAPPRSSQDTGKPLDSTPLVVLTVDASAAGQAVETALILARGIDPDRPWVEVLPHVETHLEAFNKVNKGVGRFVVPEGTRVGLAAYDREFGCTEIEVVAAADETADVDGGVQPMPMPMELTVELPERRPPATLEVTLDSVDSRSRAGHSVHIRSPRFGLKLSTRYVSKSVRTALFELPPGPYRLSYEEWAPLLCAVGPPVSQVRTHIDEIVHLEPATSVHLDRSSVAAERIDLLLQLESSDEDSEAQQALAIEVCNSHFSAATPARAQAASLPHLASVTIRPHGQGRGSYDRVLCGRSTQPSIVPRELVPIGSRFYTHRAFAPGRYDVTVHGPGIESKTTTITIEAGDGTLPFRKWKLETIVVKVR